LTLYELTYSILRTSPPWESTALVLQRQAKNAPEKSGAISIQYPSPSRRMYSSFALLDL